MSPPEQVKSLFGKVSGWCRLPNDTVVVIYRNFCNPLINANSSEWVRRLFKDDVFFRVNTVTAFFSGFVD